LAPGLASDFERRIFVTSPESCIFYQNPKCLLKGDSCDHNCSPAPNANDAQLSDEIDKLIEWRIDGKPREKET
jgi:hypothetical protein